MALLAALALTLTAGCGAGPEGDPSGAGADARSIETVPGYIPEEIALSDWLGGDIHWDTQGDVMWVGGGTMSREITIGSYDTLSGQWQRLDFDTGDARYPYLRTLSVCEDAVWALLQETFSEEQANTGTIPDDRGYYVLHIDLRDGSASCTRIDFDGDRGTESSDLFFSAILALDGDRAMLGTESSLYVIDPAANVLSRPELPVYGTLINYKVDGQLYLLTDSDDFVPLDKEGLSVGQPVTVTAEGYTSLSMSSNKGRQLCNNKGAVCLLDSATGEPRELFKWMDVALSYGSMGGGWIFENSQGEFFYPVSEYSNNGDGCIIKVTEGMVPVRKPLVLACFAEISDDTMAYRTREYDFTPAMMDVVLRFNNTDPEYKISLKPLTYTTEAERDRLLIDLATSDDVDLIDTSFLPDNALDAGFLTDMLPYIDQDSELSREDFIQPLFNAMIKDGGLYEYTEKFTMLTMSTHPELFPGREGWTVEYIEGLLAEHPDVDALWHSLDRELVLCYFSYAATAEFIDWEDMSCSFDSPAFSHWLRLIKELPYSGEYNENAKLLNISHDYAMDAGFSCRYMAKGDYVVAGFPETEGSGSYFLRLGSPINELTRSMGDNTRLGIMASGHNKDGAWRVVRMLMTHSDGYGIDGGIPVYKDSFEKAVDLDVTDREDPRFGIAYYNADDAAHIREQVYGTEKLARYDEQIFAVIRSEAEAYFAGQKTAEEAAGQIQSRLSIYLAEQS